MDAEPPAGAVPTDLVRSGQSLTTSQTPRSAVTSAVPGLITSEIAAGERNGDHEHAQVPFVDAAPEDEDARSEPVPLEPQHRGLGLRVGQARPMMPYAAAVALRLASESDVAASSPAGSCLAGSPPRSA